MDIRNKIRDRRKSKGYTQEVLAKRVGISTAHYSSFERRTANITSDLFKRVLNELDMVIVFVNKEDLL